ncbi:MAG: DNA polymerase IV [Oscillospiraceae bacterium]|nr:DNA polymerase IV [Oscillospiraceae bacterium]
MSQLNNDRIILHCDCNGFFASVSLLPHPELRDKPVVVGGSSENRHGIVLAKNEAAKKYGIKTAQTIQSALRVCPNLVILPPQRDRYEYFSKIINEIYNSYTDLVEPFGIDESWLDVTNSYALFAKDGKELADMIRERVYYETGLTISVGVSFNKVFAKLGSDYKKPNATTVISRENYKDIVWPLKVEDMLYVGRNTKEALNAMGIRTIGQLAAADKNLLEDKFGKHGRDLHIYANGIEDSPVAPFDAKREVKSIGNGNTFYRDIKGLEDIKPALMVLSEQVGMRLRKHSLYANGVQITIKNPSFVSFTRQCQIPSTNVSENIYKTALELLLKNWNVKMPIRMLTVTALDLTEEKRVQQLNLFESAAIQDDTKKENLQKALDKLKQKYGKNAVQNASVMKTDLFK